MSLSFSLLDVLCSQIPILRKEASFPSAVPKALSIPVQPQLWILWRGVMVAQMAYIESY